MIHISQINNVAATAVVQWGKSVRKRKVWYSNPSCDRPKSSKQVVTGLVLAILVVEAPNLD